MIKKTLIAAFVYIVLYYLKVPVVVTFTHQLLDNLIPLWDKMIDEWIHLMERHPYIYMSLPVILFYLMMLKHRSTGYHMLVVEDME